MTLVRYFLINEKDMTRDVVRTALLAIKRQSTADTPRLSSADARGFYFATTMGNAQLDMFSTFLKDQKVAYKFLTERPKLKAPSSVERDMTPEEVEAVDAVFEVVGEMFNEVGKLFKQLGKPPK